MAKGFDKPRSSRRTFRFSRVLNSTHQRRLGLWNALVSLCIAAVASAAIVAQLQPALTNDKALSAALHSLGYPSDYISLVRRNSTGSELYMYQSSRDGRGILVVAGDRVIRRLERPADVAYVNDEGQFVAWTDSLTQGVTFRNGVHRAIGVVRIVQGLPVYGNFDVDPGGQYFFIGTTHNGKESEIAAVAQPTKALAISRVFALQKIFATKEEIYLVGSTDSNGDSLVCETYKLEDDRALLIDSRTIADASTVRDMDPSTGRLLVLEARDFFPALKLVELASGQQKILSRLTTLGLFLQPGVMLGTAQ
jgi:hypothetical protein